MSSPTSGMKSGCRQRLNPQRLMGLKLIISNLPSGTNTRCASRKVACGSALSSKECGNTNKSRLFSKMATLYSPSQNQWALVFQPLVWSQNFLGHVPLPASDAACDWFAKCAGQAIPIGVHGTQINQPQWHHTALVPMLSNRIPRVFATSALCLK